MKIPEDKTSPLPIVAPRFPYGIWIAWIAIIILAGIVIHRYADPAPPNHLVISTGEGEGNYHYYAKEYQDLMKEDGITLELRSSSGAEENLDRLNDEKSDVSVGFVHDGLGNQEKSPDLSSLGSLYYEPIWIFYRSKTTLSKISDLKGKRFAIGPTGGGTHILVENIIKAAGLNSQNTTLTEDVWDKAADALIQGQVDAAAFMGTADESVIQNFFMTPRSSS